MDIVTSPRQSTGFTQIPKPLTYVMASGRDSMLPDQTNIRYNTVSAGRTRPHNMTMINRTKFLNETDFIIHMLYKYSY